MQCAVYSMNVRNVYANGQVIRVFRIGINLITPVKRCKQKYRQVFDEREKSHAIFLHRNFQFSVFMFDELMGIPNHLIAMLMSANEVFIQVLHIPRYEHTETHIEAKQNEIIVATK